MRTRDVIAKTKKFEDLNGFDLADTTKLHSKKDCKERLLSHRRWMENRLTDAFSHIDDFIKQLGLDSI